MAHKNPWWDRPDWVRRWKSIVAEANRRPETQRKRRAAMLRRWRDASYRAARSVTWTKEMDRALVRLRAAGIGILECAEEIGVGHTQCSARAKALGVGGRHAPKRHEAGRLHD